MVPNDQPDSAFTMFSFYIDQTSKVSKKKERKGKFLKK